MKYTLCEDEFINLFDSYDRSENFSRAARRTMFNYYEELEADIGEEIDVDVIALCCGWSEYKAQELVNYYGYMTCEELPTLEQVLEMLADNTTVIKVDHYKDEESWLVEEF